MTTKKNYRTSTLEAIARRIIEDYNPALICGKPQAIPIEEIVESHFRLDVEYRCLRKNGIALGCTVFDDMLLPVYNMETRQYELIPVKGGTIVIDTSLLHSRTDGRLRFTFAHELAHWIIHKEMFAGTMVAAASTSKVGWEDNSLVERQADILATALLMPAVQVKRAFYELRSTGNSVDPVKALAGLFDVSQQAMDIFFREHCLI